MTERHGGRFIEGKVISVDPSLRQLFLDDGRRIRYDVVSFNVGSVVEPREDALRRCPHLVSVKPVERLLELKRAIETDLRIHPCRVIVVGGGAAGVEVAAAARSLNAPDGVGRGTEVTIVTRSSILSGFPKHVAAIARRKLTALGITLLERRTVIDCDGSIMTFSDGTQTGYDRAVLATGTRPPSLFADSGLPVGGTGGLLVSDTLNCRRFPEVFGGGDCIDFEKRPIAKVGVYAVRESRVLRDNLHAALLLGPDAALRAFAPQRHYSLIINFSDGTALAYRKPFRLRGRSAFALKDRIDTAFMREFQECGEAHVSPSPGQE